MKGLLHQSYAGWTMRMTKGFVRQRHIAGTNSERHLDSAREQAAGRSAGWLDGTLRPWFEGRLLPVTAPIAERWGLLSGEQQLQGKQVKVADGLIVATALHHNLTIVTRNVKDF